MRKFLLCLAVAVTAACGDDLGWDQDLNKDPADCYDAPDKSDEPDETSDVQACNLCQDATADDASIEDTQLEPEIVEIVDSNAEPDEQSDSQDLSDLSTSDILSDSGGSDSDDVGGDINLPDTQTDTAAEKDAEDVGEDTVDAVPPPECLTATDCSADDNPCTDAECIESKCVQLSNSATCTDKDSCTENDLCVDSKCTSGKSKLCDDGNGCTDDSCDPDSGCVYLPNQVTCTDGNACTEIDVCFFGLCAGSAVDCDDKNVCTDDSCDSTAGCANLPNQATCTDGDACTLDDTCAGSQCVSGSQVSCPSVTCVLSSCVMGKCEDDFTFLNDTGCDDGALCTTLSKCLDGKCLAVDSKSCDDGNLCTTEFCNEKTGACESSKVPDDTPCGKDSVCVDGVCKLLQLCGDVDSDGDGVNDKCDCEPLNKFVSPNLSELCDGADNNCNGSVDEGQVCGTSGIIQISVVDSSSKSPLVGASVSVKPAGKCASSAELAAAVTSTVTPVDGKVTLKPDPGDYCIEAVLTEFKKSISSDFSISAGEVRPLIIPMVPATSSSSLISVCGLVTDSSTSLPISNASVSIAVNSPDNVVGTAKSDVTGLYCVIGIKGVTNAIITAAAEGFISDKKNITPPTNGVGIVQDFELKPSQAGVCYQDDFETGLIGWVIDAVSSGNQWQVLDNAAPVKNKDYPACVNVWASELCIPNPNDISDSCQICGSAQQLACIPEAGSLPRSAKGTHAFWYGSLNTGNFNGINGAQCPNKSGGNGPANGGTATTPEQTLPAGSADYTLRFSYWYEIEGVAPQYPTFDSMNIYVSLNGGSFNAVGHLNPSTSFGYQGPDAYTSGGGGQAPAWGVREISLPSAKAGDKIKVKFEFKTGDGAFNAFRGWVLDDLRIMGAGCI